MKKYQLLLFVLSMSILFTSCGKKPTACFVIPPNIHVFTWVMFDCSCSKNAEWYELSIDGAEQISGASSQEQIGFTSTGDHIVKLITYSAGKKLGYMSEMSQTVTVLP
ncbi:MAG: hypothetical protein ACXVPU_06790 [Bacteroidia bacterium]